MNTARLTRILPISAAIVAAAAVSPTPTVAAQPFGPDTCINGFVWREAAPGDNVCVTPATRDATAAQNAQAIANRDPLGAFGSNSCKQGFVWREAFDGDVVCVTPDVRAATKADNAQAASRKVASAPQQAPAAPAGKPTVVFEVTGAGEVFNIVTDPPTSAVADHTPLPWTRTITVDPNEDMLQVVATGRDGQPGCRITMDGRVVAEQPIGGSAHCIWTR
jgi:hypothetical protein